MPKSTELEYIGFRSTQQKKNVYSKLKFQLVSITLRKRMFSIVRESVKTLNREFFTISAVFYCLEIKCIFIARC